MEIEIRSSYFLQATQVGSLCWNTYPAQGVVINFNTLEAFKSFDKTKYLDAVEGSQIWEAIQSGEAAKRPGFRFSKHLLCRQLQKSRSFYD